MRKLTSSLLRQSSTTKVTHDFYLILCRKTISLIINFGNDPKDTKLSALLYSFVRKTLVANICF